MLNRSSYGLARVIAVAFIVFAVFASTHVRTSAHEGEDHGDAGKPAVSTGVGEVLRVAKAHDIEILVKHEPPASDVPTHARVYLTKAETNEPVEGADVVVVLLGAGRDIRVSAASADPAGTYLADLPALGAGTYEFTIALTTGGETQSIGFGAYEVASSFVTTDAASVSPTARVIGAVAIALAALGAYSFVVFAWFRGTRRSRREAATA